MDSSQVATLTVWVLPRITAQPQSLVVTQGNTAVFSVLASGVPNLSYQWRANGVNLASGSRVSGASSATLTITGALTNDALNYTVIITNSAGAITSQVALLTVLVPPYITVQPASLTVTQGYAANFNVAAAGTAPLGYQWRTNGVSLPNGGRFSGAKTASLSVMAAATNDALNYSVVVTNAIGSITSQAATLTVWVPPSIAQQPASLVVTQGSTATFSVSAIGIPVPTYQWRTNGVDLPNGGRVSGATSASLTITGALTNDALRYTVVVANPAGAITSQVATLTVWVPPVITTQPQSLVVTQGNTTVFGVTAIGIPSLSYQWRADGVNLANGGRVSGASSPTLSITGALTNDALNYTVVLTNSAGAITSQVATLTVWVPPVITTQPQSLVVTQGNTAVFSVLASGKPNPSYQWRADGVNLANAGRVSGASSPTLTITGVLTNDALNYRVVVTNSAGAITSQVATLTVVVAPFFTCGTNITGKQGVALSFTNTTVGTLPITFRSGLLPSGLSLNSSNGIISGVPMVYGMFPASVTASNNVGMATNYLQIALTTGVPGITSALTASGKQGQVFNYTITASNSPISFSASGLPTGLSLNATNGVISGTPWVSGTFSVVVGAANEWGTDSRALTLTIASGVPVITSATSASGSENASFSHQITATETPTSFGAAGLPLGLTLNPNNGAVSGSPLYGGPFDVVVWAGNQWGTGSNTLHLNLSYAAISVLTIQNVEPVYSAPYLLDFMFSLRDSTNTLTSHAVVRPLDQFTASPAEDGYWDPMESYFILDRGDKKQLRCCLVLDYSQSMTSTNSSAPVTYKSPNVQSMENAARTFISQMPADTLLGIYEFHGLPVPSQVKDFTMDKAALIAAVDNLWMDPARDITNTTWTSRCWDGVKSAIDQFSLDPVAVADEHRYVVFISDGKNNASRYADTNAVVTSALAHGVKLYCVGYGSSINTNNLAVITAATKGRYYLAQDPATLASQFAQIGKDIDGQYILRWATPQRFPQPFKPSFTISCNGYTAGFNTNNGVDAVPQYNPADASVVGGETNGVLRFVETSSGSGSALQLRAKYVPMNITRVRIQYRANYPCTVSLKSTGPGEILSGWSLTETNDGVGGKWLELRGSTTIRFGAMGNLLRFEFRDSTNTPAAFSLFQMDNSIYPKAMGQNFVVQNVTNYTTAYEATPHGTPVPWLLTNGFTNNFAAAELSDPDGDGVPTWQEYWAGTNPRDKNSAFTVRPVSAPTGGQPFQMRISTVVGRTYRVETATSFGVWSVLQDSIVGTGGQVAVTDNRNLAGVKAVFYRAAVY